MPTYLTVKDVATRLKLHPNTVLSYIEHNLLVAIRAGRSYRISEAAFQAYVDRDKKIVDIQRVAIANQKGGVAKTTTAVNLATALAQLGKKVLLIDLDPQGGCAVSLGLDTSKLDRTIYDVLVKNMALVDVIQETDYGFDLAPANIDLAGAEVELKQILAQESVLKRRLAPINDKYEYILFDTPPSLGVLTVNALTAASSVLIPVSCEVMALRGLRMLLDTIYNVQNVTNPDLRIMGIVPTRYDSRTNASHDVHEYLQNFGKREGIALFAPVKNATRYTEAPGEKKPGLILSPSNATSLTYMAIAQEISHAA